MNTMENQTWLEKLASPDWKTRQRAVESLRTADDPQILDGLLTALRDGQDNLGLLNAALQALSLAGFPVVDGLAEMLAAEEADTRLYAAQALGSSADPRAAAPLIAALGDPDLNVRYQAIESLGNLAPLEAGEPLLEILREGDFFLAYPALEALAKIADNRAAPDLLTLLKDEALAPAAVDALGRLGDPRLLEPLLAWLDSPLGEAEPIVAALLDIHRRCRDELDEPDLIPTLTRGAITPGGMAKLAAALENAAPEWLGGLCEVIGWLEGEFSAELLLGMLENDPVRDQAARALIRAGGAAVPGLIERLEQGAPEIRRAAAAALGSIGDPRAVSPLITALGGEDPGLASLAAGALGKIGDSRAFDPLLGHLGHPSALVRQSVIGAVNSLGHPDHTARMLALLEAPDPLVRAGAVKSLGYFGDPAAAGGLLAAARDEDPEVRQAALETLAFSDHPQVPGVLMAALESAQAPERAAAARALAFLEPAQALPLLAKAAADPDPWVRLYACRSLGRLGSPRGIPIIRQAAAGAPPHVGRTAAEALGKIGGADILPALRELLESPSAEVGEAALRALSAARLPAALEMLCTALEQGSSRQRLAAAESLSNFESGEAACALAEAARGDPRPEVRRAAIASLGRCGHPRSLTELVDLSAQPQVREWALDALADAAQACPEDVENAFNRHPVQRRTLIEALRRVRRTWASELIAAALDDPDADNRLTALEALASLGSSAGLPQRIYMARHDPDPEVRAAAQSSLRTAR